MIGVVLEKQEKLNGQEGFTQSAPAHAYAISLGRGNTG
jgi:hypothetical protein